MNERREYGCDRSRAPLAVDFESPIDLIWGVVVEIAERKRLVAKFPVRGCPGIQPCSVCEDHSPVRRIGSSLLSVESCVHAGSPLSFVPMPLNRARRGANFGSVVSTLPTPSLCANLSLRKKKCEKGIVSKKGKEFKEANHDLTKTRVFVCRGCIGQ